MPHTPLRICAPSHTVPELFAGSYVIQSSRENVREQHSYLPADAIPNAEVFRMLLEIRQSGKEHLQFPSQKKEFPKQYFHRLHVHSVLHNCSSGQSLQQSLGAQLRAWPRQVRAFRLEATPFPVVSTGNQVANQHLLGRARKRKTTLPHIGWKRPREARPDFAQYIQQSAEFSSRAT